MQQLGHEEQKAIHRMCGDQFLEDVDLALRSQLDPMLTSEYCQKLFTAIDADGSGAIDAEELRIALVQLRVFLTDEEAAAIGRFAKHSAFARRCTPGGNTDPE
jgi:hypothetical protein